MKRSSVDECLVAPATDANERNLFLRNIALTQFAVLAWCVLWYWPTAVEIAGIWWRSDTFAHGLIVLPVFAWLVWRGRARTIGLRPDPVPWLALPAAAAGFLWLLGQLASVAAAAHAGLVLMVVIGLVAALGWRLARVFLFPLAFLLFGIPIGDFLLPTLMDYTAWFTVSAVRFSGVPVYQEGLHFVVPNGRWSVVEACSGIRYLIASVMVGSLYAYLNYASQKKRLLFMLVAILVPIVANWLRAYMIVMLGYLSDNEIAAGVDHLIYGWVFFGVVIMLMFWIGQRWTDPAAAFVVPQPVPSAAGRVRWEKLVPVALVIAAFPLIHASIDSPVEPYTVAYELPAPAPGWSAEEPAAIAYRPRYGGFRGEATGAYRNESGDAVLLYTALYAQQRDDAEMVTWGNSLAEAGSARINLIVEPNRQTAVGRVRSAVVVEAGRRYAVLHWYGINGNVVTRDAEAKLRLAVDRLLGLQDTSVAFVLIAPAEDEEQGFARLDSFIEAHAAGLDRLAADRIEGEAP